MWKTIVRLYFVAFLVIYSLLVMIAIGSAYSYVWIASYSPSTGSIRLHARADDGIQWIQVFKKNGEFVFYVGYSSPYPHDVTFSIENVWPDDFPLLVPIMEYEGIYREHTIRYKVGGFVIPVDKFGLLAPYLGLASTALVATVASVVYAKRVKRRKEKQ